MLTFKKWQEDTVKRLVLKYRCTQAEAELCCDRWRWYREHIQPAMKAGQRPDPAVAKSLVEHCPYSVRQLQREFLSYGHGEEFWPVGYDLKGYKIQYSF